MVSGPTWPSWERTGWGSDTEPGLMGEPSLWPLSPSALCSNVGAPDLPTPSTVIAQKFSRELTKQLLLWEENKAKHMRMAESSFLIPSLPCVEQLAPSPPPECRKNPLLKSPVVALLVASPGIQGTPWPLARWEFRQCLQQVLPVSWFSSLLLCLHLPSSRPVPWKRQTAQCSATVS